MTPKNGQSGLNYSSLLPCSLPCSLKRPHAINLEKDLSLVSSSFVVLIPNLMGLGCPQVRKASLNIYAYRDHVKIFKKPNQHLLLEPLDWRLNASSTKFPPSVTAPLQNIPYVIRAIVIWVFELRLINKFRCFFQYCFYFCNFPTNVIG